MRSNAIGGHHKSPRATFRLAVSAGVICVLFAVHVTAQQEPTTTAKDPNVAIQIAGSSKETAVDYKKLTGKWRWDYDLGHSTLTIIEVIPSGGDVSIFAEYEVNTPSWGINTYGKAAMMMGSALPDGSIELKFVSANQRGWSFQWDGKDKLSGYGTLSGWEGYGDFYKQP